MGNFFHKKQKIKTEVVSITWENYGKIIYTMEIIRSNTIKDENR